MESPRALLDSAYAGLRLEEGVLLEASEKPTASTASEWVDKGDWLALAKCIGAERVFFVGNNPVIVFASSEAEDRTHWARTFNESWCMARPQLLFLATPGELCVYNLSETPVREADEPSRRARLLASARTAPEVQSKLAEFRRSQIESGRLFEERRFGFDTRADRALIRDLKKVREQLDTRGLRGKDTHIHALIGRSIFIRYLEDRGILTDAYFRDVAKRFASWGDLVEDALAKADSHEGVRSVYAEILHHEPLLYALFEQLAEHFNGDIFRSNAEEKQLVDGDHLRELQSFLLGEIDQPLLFFFAYKFDIIPIELISSIYEEFYNVEQGKSNNQGSFYTPSALVEFVLSQTLTEEILVNRPRVMDPACGSGIFLVEAFRRIVRSRVRELGRRLKADELRRILRDQICGIDINPEAVRVAAFSLYLALLHYQKRSDVLHSKRLPNLTYDPDRVEHDPRQHFDILLPFNAFDLEGNVRDAEVRRRFASGSVDVIVGNPPWGDPASPRDPATKGKSKATSWCKVRGKSVGDRELSQAFVHRTLDLLREGGRAGLLLATGVFFKRQKNSRLFRDQWLRSATLKHVVNFAAVWDVFFTSKQRKAASIAPFASVVFQKAPTAAKDSFEYWSAKKTAFIEGTQCVVLHRSDLRTVRQQAVAGDDVLWKVYWWGGHRDEALIQALRLERTLRSVVGPDEPGCKRFGLGYEKGERDARPNGWLRRYKELPPKRFQRYGPIPSDALIPPPERVRRRGVREVYEGVRILVSRGVPEEPTTQGKIVGRLESTPFCFRHSIHGVRLPEELRDSAELLLGILWSSLIRYYLWMTSGSWGMWHHEILQTTLEELPIRVPGDANIVSRIRRIVSELRNFDFSEHGLFTRGRSQREIQETIAKLESDLDDAVSDLYELSSDERDLVREMCSVGLDLFYRGTDSDSLKPIPSHPRAPTHGRRKNIPRQRDRQAALAAYVDAFLEIWNRELAPDGEFRWRIVRPEGDSSMLAVVFEAEQKSDPLPKPAQSDDVAWRTILNRLADTSSYPVGTRSIYIDGLTRIVTQHDVVIIKRNERRLWTRTAAREDAEATLLQAMHRQGELARSTA